MNFSVEFVKNRLNSFPIIFPRKSLIGCISSVGTGGLGGDLPGLPQPPWRRTPRRPKHKFTLPLLDLPGTIMYLEENFLCKNALKVKCTLSLVDPW